MKDNKVVFERYYGFSHPGALHPISSVTKSITSLAIGVCCDRGLIHSIDSPIASYFPEFESLYLEEPSKGKISIRHLLNQTSGFDWDEWTIHYSYAGNQLVEMSHYKGNWLEYIMNLPMGHEPGTHFTYNSGNSELLKEIVCRVSNLDFVDFVNEYLFTPLCISDFYWERYQMNGPPAWGGLSLSSRDMIKIGLVVLNGGTYGKSSVVSESWINTTFDQPIEAENMWYGLHWWISQLEGTQEPFYYAAGYGDQYVFVVPSRNSVVAINAQNFTDFRFDKTITELFQQIMDAIV